MVERNILDVLDQMQKIVENDEGAFETIQAIKDKVKGDSNFCDPANQTVLWLKAQRMLNESFSGHPKGRELARVFAGK